MRGFKGVVGILLLLATSLTGQITTLNNLEIHGFLTQSYGRSSNYTIFGIPVGGTTDLRSLALQFQHQTTASISATVQFSHFRLANSPGNDAHEPLELDWAFIQYRLNEHFQIRLGKVLLPFGIYNEIQDVGALLPFFRPPYIPYSEGRYLSETLSGATALISFELLGRANELEVYTGEWSWQEWFLYPAPFGSEAVSISGDPKIDKSLGGRYWFFPGPEGFRLGGSFQQGDVAGGLAFVEGEYNPQTFRLANIAVDVDRERFMLRGESNYFTFRPTGLRSYGSYAQAGIRVREKFWVNTQGQFFNVRNMPVKNSTRRRESNVLKELAASAVFHLSPNLSIKGEHHWVWSKLTESYYPIYWNKSPAYNRYWVISFSNHF
ncbi:MAG TPA: hypothetical protein PKV71_05080 [Calditrichia bacterium]|nr:hypothetical protein [Calditrichota bacterium]HQU71994.1 hypothetical protein [Calditrichia bacterium]HQV31225.1 hypothetical protein [Calditrichia bacterium]